MIPVSGPAGSQAKAPTTCFSANPHYPREPRMSLFTLVSSLLRPTTTAQRVQRQRPRTRLNLETLEDRRLLSGFHGSGLDDVQPVEVEHSGASLDTPSVMRGLDDNTLGIGVLDFDRLHIVEAGA